MSNREQQTRSHFDLYHQTCGIVQNLALYCSWCSQYSAVAPHCTSGILALPFTRLHCVFPTSNGSWPCDSAGLMTSYLTMCNVDVYKQGLLSKRNAYTAVLKGRSWRPGRSTWWTTTSLYGTDLTYLSTTDDHRLQSKRLLYNSGYAVHQMKKWKYSKGSVTNWR